MLGAIAGDIIGSFYEWENVKSTDFLIPHPQSRFTDDTVLTVATAHCIMYHTPYDFTYQDYAQRYPGAGYGGNFKSWIYLQNPLPYNSWGNGSAMRVSPIGFAYDSEEEVREKAKKSALVTHNHPDGIDGAVVMALAVFWARNGASKSFIREKIESEFGYNLQRTLDEIRPDYKFDVSCKGSVPEAIIAFLESTDFEDAIRKAISLGGDSDTIACMCGGIAHAFYKQIPPYFMNIVDEILPDDLRKITDVFQERYKVPY